MAREAAQEVKPTSSARSTATWPFTPVSKSSIDTVNEPRSTGVVVNPQGKVSARLVGAPSLTLKGRDSTLFPAFDSLEVDPAHNFVTSCNQLPTSVTSPSSSPSTQPTTPASSGFNNRIGNPTATSSESPPDPSSPVAGNDNITSTGDGSLTTEVVETAVVTSGVVGVTTTATAADGHTTVITSLSSFTSTHQVKTTIVTHRPTDGVRSVDTKTNIGPIVGSVISGVLGLLLILVAALCIFRRQSRKRRSAVDKNVDPYNMIQQPTVNIDPLGEQQNYHHAEMGTNISSAMPSLLRGIDSGTSTSQKRGEGHIPTVTSALQHSNEQDDSNPFRDPDTAEVHQVQQARGALDRLQQLTREVEAELQNLANQVESGQLSVTEQQRLDEIRRTAGLTITYDSRLRRFLSTSSTSSAPPPSYHSENVPFLQSDLPH